MTSRPYVGVIGTSDGEETLQCLSGERSLDIVGRMIAHEVDDEVMRDGWYEPGERSREVIWVIVNGEVMDIFVMIAEVVKGISRCEVVQCIKATEIEGCCIAVVEVGIAPCRRCITLIYIMGPRYA